MYVPDYLKKIYMKKMEGCGWGSAHWHFGHRIRYKLFRKKIFFVDKPVFAVIELVFLTNCSKY